MPTPDEPAPATLTPDEPTPAAATAVGLGRVNLPDSSNPLLNAAIAVGLGRVKLPDEPGSAAELLNLLVQRHIDADEPTPVAATADEPASAEPRERESSFSTSFHYDLPTDVRVAIADEAAPTNLLDLPDEIVSHVLSYLGATELCLAAGVKSLRMLVEDAAKRSLARTGLRPAVRPYRFALWYVERRSNRCNVCSGDAAQVLSRQLFALQQLSGCTTCSGTGCAFSRVELSGCGGVPRNHVLQQHCRHRVFEAKPRVGEYWRLPATPYENDNSTVLLRPSRLPQDRYGWWITSTVFADTGRHVATVGNESLPGAAPGQQYYYANMHKGRELPMRGWLFLPTMENGLGWSTRSPAVGPAPVLRYVLPEGGPPLRPPLGPSPRDDAAATAAEPEAHA